MTQTTTRGGQTARTPRTFAKPVTTVRPPLPRLPFRPEDLFREAAYTDGQPYARDDEDEDGDA
jgi:hypothetical protein